jgi:hypothetical protein
VHRSATAGKPCSCRIGRRTAGCGRRVFGISQPCGSRVFGIGGLPERTAEPLHLMGLRPFKSSLGVQKKHGCASFTELWILSSQGKWAYMEPGPAFALRIATLLICGAAAAWGVMNEDMRFGEQQQQRHAFTAIRAWWRS